MNRLRFFYVVSGPRAAYVVVAGVLIGFAGYIAATAPDTIDQTLGMALFLQLFAASTGYRDRLQRGHFDPVLVARPHPATIAAAHWLLSIGFGATVWGVLGAASLLGNPSRLPTAFTPPAVLVLLYVSTVVWAASLPLGRYAGGILWIVTIFILASTQHLQALRVSLLAPDGTWTNAVRAAAAVLSFPVFLLFESTPPRRELLLAVLVAGAAAWAAGALLIARFRGTLVDH